MSTKAASKVASHVISVQKKHTVQSRGIWEAFRKVVAIDANRSNGVPLNPTFRNPTPGAVLTEPYDDPVTLPAGDIADNAYFKRDSRRAYPKLSVVGQADAVALLTVGSAATPKVDLIGESGEKQLVAAQEDGQIGGLAKFLEKAPKEAAVKDLFVGGLPPLPSGQSLVGGKWDVYKYELSEEDGTYGEGYPCRSFA